MSGDEAFGQRAAEASGGKASERKEETRRESTRERKEVDRGSSGAREMRDNSRAVPANRPSVDRSSNDRREMRPERSSSGNNRNTGGNIGGNFGGNNGGNANLPSKFNGQGGLPFSNGNQYGNPPGAGAGNAAQNMLPTTKDNPNSNKLAPNQQLRDLQDEKQFELELLQKEREAEREDKRQAEEFEKQQKLDREKAESLRKEAEQLQSVNAAGASQKLTEAQQLIRDIDQRGARFLNEQTQAVRRRLLNRELALAQWRGNRDAVAAARAARPRPFPAPNLAARQANAPRPEAPKPVALTPEQLAETILDLSADDPERVIAALKKLGSVEPTEQRTKASVAILAHLDKKEPGKYALAAKALAVWGDAARAPILLQLIDSNDKETRHAAMRSLGFLKRTEAAQKVAAKLVVPADRRAAAHALEDMGPAAEAVVLPYLTHEDMWVRAESAMVLKEVGGVASRKALADLAENDPEAFVRTRANEALRELGG